MVSIDGKFQGYSFRPPKRANLESKRFGVLKTCTELCRTVDVWITVSLQKFF